MKPEKRVKGYVERARKFIDERSSYKDGGSPEWFAWLQSPQGIIEIAKMIQKEESKELKG